MMLTTQVVTGRSSVLFLLAATAVALVGCADADEAPIGTAANALTHAAPELPGANCPAGGQALQFGVDANRNGQLDANEVQSTSFVCNGTSSSAPVLRAIPVGDSHCPYGGTALAVSGSDEVTVCNGTPGADGKTGARGEQGVQGEQGPQGDAGAQGPGTPDPMLGQFLPSQTVKGAVVTCASNSTAATTVTCTGLKVDGVPTRLAPNEANVICTVVTGKGYNTANGMGVTSGPYLLWNGSGWALSTASTSPMDNLTCNR
jgi:hypothetical protein